MGRIKKVTPTEVVSAVQSVVQPTPVRPPQESPYFSIFEMVKSGMMSKLDYFSLSEIPSHVIKKLDRIVTATSYSEAAQFVKEAEDTWFMHYLARGKPKDKKYFQQLAEAEESRAASFQKRGWDEAARKHMELAKEYRLKEAAAPENKW